MEKLQPKLRFPDFVGSWNKNKLGDLFYISAGGDIKQEFVSQTKNETFKYPIYANAEKNKGFYAYSSIYKIDEDVITIAGRGVNIGIAHARKEKFYPIVRLLVLKPKNNLSVDFFEYAINNFDIVVESTGVPQLTAPQISNYEIYYCDYNEQTRIANFLSSVDEKLNLLKEKKKLLEDYKKGIMQKIFNQEIRFKDDNGKDFEDWEEKTLGEIIKEISEKTTISNQYKIVSSTVKGLIFQDEYFNRDIASKDNSGYKIIRLNNLVLSPQNLWMGNINFNDKFPVGIVSPSYKIFEFNLDIVIPLYCKYYLLTDLMIKKYEQCSVMGASVVRRSLDINLFYELNIFLPSIAEQTKIANFLTAIDEKIELVSNQIKDTQEYKRGLLQQMFV
jgi:type I restriction enzyme S subunit